MILKNLKPLGYLLLAIMFFYFLHSMVFKFLNVCLNQNIFKYSLQELYLYFSVFSIIIIALIIKIKQKNIDLVGNVFLLTTCVKLIVCFLLIRTSIDNPNFNHSLEKWNFLSMFMIFLILETVTTIVILNKKK